MSRNTSGHPASPHFTSCSTGNLLVCFQGKLEPTSLQARSRRADAIQKTLGLVVDHILCLDQENDSYVLLDWKVWNGKQRSFPALGMISAYVPTLKLYFWSLKLVTVISFLKKTTTTRDPACNVTVVSQRFQPHFTKTEPQQKPVIIIKTPDYLLLITPGKMIEFHRNMTYISCHTYSNTSSTSNNYAHVYGCQNEYFLLRVFFFVRASLLKKKSASVSVAGDRTCARACCPPPQPTEKNAARTFSSVKSNKSNER